MKAKPSKKTSKPAAPLKDLKPKADPKAGRLKIEDPDEGGNGGVLLP